jgi:hypothetical protein
VALSRGYRKRRAAWLELTAGNDLVEVGSRAGWRFDRGEAFDAAVLVLTRGSLEKIDGYIAAGSILDVWEGRPPTSTVPDSWRALPSAVLSALRLEDGAPSAWFTRTEVRPADEALREASILASLCEVAGDDWGRAMFDDVARLRSRPTPPIPTDVVPLVELPGMISRIVDLERQRGELEVKLAEATKPKGGKR